jgi:hypothetical protein
MRDKTKPSKLLEEFFNLLRAHRASSSKIDHIGEAHDYTKSVEIRDNGRGLERLVSLVQ